MPHDDPGERGFVVGRLGRPNGLKGFIGLYVEDADLVHFEPGSHVMIGEAERAVRAIRRGNKGHEVAFEDVLDRDAAEAIRGMEVRVSARRRLEPEEFWPEDLVGLEVRPGGGVIAGVEHGPGQDRLVVERGATSFAVPFVTDLVPNVDLEAGFVEIREIEGLSPQ